MVLGASKSSSEIAFVQDPVDMRHFVSQICACSMESLMTMVNNSIFANCSASQGVALVVDFKENGADRAAGKIAFLTALMIDRVFGRQLRAHSITTSR